MSTMYLHFFDSNVLALDVFSTSDEDLSSVLDYEQLKSAVVVHGEDRTLCIPKPQLIYIEYRNESVFTQEDLDKMKKILGQFKTKKH